jgi:GNAT superfamily N-acetyltransferase
MDFKVKIRLATPDDAAAIARVQVATWRSTYIGILPAATLANLSYERSEATWRTGLERINSVSFLYVALDDNDTIYGFAAAGKERNALPSFGGEIYALYVLQGAQRKGTGRALVRAAAQELLARGIDSLLIWVLHDNLNGRGFYEAIGGEYVGDQEIMIDEQLFAERGYGWRDLAKWVADEE